MKILTVLTYYRPHTSGLTIYAERLARAFVKRGHEVTVMTTHYDPSLPLEEMMDGVKVIRIPVIARVSKGVIAPTFGLVATKLVWQHDVVQLHLPQFDAPGVAMRARLFGKPVVLTYHCDVQLPQGWFNRFVNSVLDFQNDMAGRLANHIVTYTQDYADHSPYLSRYASKLTPILPPVEMPVPAPEAVTAFAEKHRTKELKPVIGMVTRFASEKGVEILLDALPIILKKYPNAQVLYAGQHQNVMGEQAYFDRLIPKIHEYETSGHWTFLGNLTPVQLAALYPNLDVLTVPSLNSTEAFGLVQIEAMMNGVPSVPSALPGVRRPVQMHGMGVVSEIGNAQSLAASILEVLDTPAKYRGDVDGIKTTYDPDSVAQEYEKMFERLKGRTTG
ncbi:MAG TPA: glycosyltransferase family 4 protein [Anaerolineales bacterium]|nr:glycosyltransferase family 4 protein [Anaerolineales bacterium]HMX20066.1 glycosyltransferase family 4 protein [Anaerolineales bacterium]HMZ43804.1 glycosyltransferase family 4 protein [Anaerolineales bacterium]HNA56387.1 glycosyltransferase family 4 protein [Anaerolineales bacterium]HNB88484.1 glycosyltransferase family 4 protein [Anaerolineales bacterium]